MKVGDKLDDGRIVEAPAGETDRPCPECSFKKTCAQIVTKIDCVHYGAHQDIIRNPKTGQPVETVTRFDCGHAIRDLITNAQGAKLIQISAELQTLRQEFASVLTVIADMTSPEVRQKIFAALERGWEITGHETVAKIVHRETIDEQAIP
jgi:hypothetical protein